MNDLRQAAEMALKAMDLHVETYPHMDKGYMVDARSELRQALDDTKQEPVAWMQKDHLQKAIKAPFMCRVEPTQRLTDFIPIYTTPPKREWVELTKNDVDSWPLLESPTVYEFSKYVEAKLKAKNNGF